jgi:hypothetical protein
MISGQSSVGAGHSGMKTQSASHANAATNAKYPQWRPITCAIRCSLTTHHAHLYNKTALM